MAIRLPFVIFCTILGSFLEELKLKAQEIKQEKAEAIFLMYTIWDVFQPY